MLKDLGLEEFVERLSSEEPTPGGGSASALGGALAASLLSMACSLTIGREKFREEGRRLEPVREKARGWKKELVELVDRDSEAFRGVMSALALPKKTDPERAARKEALAEANRFAAEVPLRTAETCFGLLELAGEAAARANPNAISDVGVAALLARCGMEGAILNVEINLPGVGEAGFVERARQRVATLRSEGERRLREILGTVRERMG